MATGSKSQKFTYRPGIDDTFFTIFQDLKKQKKVSKTIRRALFLFMGLPDDIIKLPKEVFEEAYQTLSGDKILTDYQNYFDTIQMKDMRFIVKSKTLEFSYSLKDNQFQELLSKIKNDNKEISSVIIKSVLFYNSFSSSLDDVSYDELIDAYLEKKSSPFLIRRVFLIAEATLKRMKLTAELQDVDMSFTEPTKLAPPSPTKESEKY